MSLSLPTEPVPQGTDVAHELAAFVSGNSYASLPPEIIERAKRSILDLIGVAALGARSESAQAFLAYVTAQGGKPEATIMCGGGQTTAYYAAVMSGMYAHATELSETFTRAIVHPGNVILPALFAVGEREHASGQQLIAGTALGYEVLVRVGLSLGVPWSMEQGFHMPSALGPFGATAGCASMLGLGLAQTRNAFGITACYTPTTLNAAFEGATIKELFEGSAASVGVMSADLARAGITGVQDWDKHWYKATARRSGLFALVDGLGDRWVIESGGLHFKLRAVVAMGQPVIDAAEQLANENHLDADEIETVLVESSNRVVLGGARAPDTIVGAKASVPYLAAVALVRPGALATDPHLTRTLTADFLRDEAVKRVAGLVELRVDPVIDREFEVDWPMKFAARVTVTTKDGRTLSQYADVWPRSSKMTYDEVAAKFRDVTSGGILKPDNVEKIVESVRHLEQVADVSEIVSLIS